MIMGMVMIKLLITMWVMAGWLVMVEMVVNETIYDADGGGDGGYDEIENDLIAGVGEE